LEAVEHGEGPILIAAGAGSGKTRTLTARLAKILERGAKPEEIVAITFTNKAAQEMRERVAKQINNSKITENLFIGTFHSFGARILRTECRLLGRTMAYTIYDSDDSLALIKQVMKSMNLSKEKHSASAFQREISRVKNELIQPEEYLDEISARVYQDYEEALAKNNAFDFDDLIEKVAQLFKKHPAVKEKYQNQFRYVLVDEYQDVNTSQYYFARLLAEKHQNISVVGDDQQAIYSFRSADFRNFLNFERDWPKAKVVKLEQNYRSVGNIITAASAVVANNTMQKPKTLWTESPAGELVKIVQAADAEAEAWWVAEEIQNKLENRNEKLESITVLYRTNAQSRAIEQALISLRIPYRLFGGVKFYERKEVKDMLAGLRFAHNPKDAVSRERLEKAFTKAVREKLISDLPNFAEKLTLMELINFFLVNADYFEYLDKHFKNANERVENINELIVFASEFKTLGEFLEKVTLLQSADRSQNGENVAALVNLMTIHIAKGLEFDSVFLVGCNEGFMPHQFSYGKLEDIEEERRLMYVAMTRAKKNLYISFADLPSRFLGEIPGDLTEFINLTGKSKTLDDEYSYIEDGG